MSKNNISFLEYEKINESLSRMQLLHVDQQKLLSIQNAEENGILSIA